MEILAYHKQIKQFILFLHGNKHLIQTVYKDKILILGYINLNKFEKVREELNIVIIDLRYV